MKPCHVRLAHTTATYTGDVRRVYFGSEFFNSMTLCFWIYFVTSSVLVSMTTGTPCDQILSVTTAASVLTSEGYPLKYAPNTSCWWLLRATDESRFIVVEVLDSKIQPSPGCSEDSLTIYDGATSASTVLSKLCGDTRVMHASTGNDMYLLFQSDAELETRGIQVRYYSTSNSNTPCSYNLTASRHVKTITSPGYPVGYFNNLECIFIIRALDLSDRIMVNFVDSEIQESSSCTVDKVSVTNVAVNGARQLLSTVCGTVKPSFQSGENTLELMLETDASKVNKGFLIEYRSIPKENCRYTLTTTNSESFLISPGYPTKYFSNLQCQFTIETPDSLSVVQVNVESAVLSPTCAQDSVQILDYDRTEIRTLCGPSEDAFRSTGSKMFITFTTDDTHEERGFLLRYSKHYDRPPDPEACGGMLTASAVTQSLKSPGYPLAYLSTLSCTWTIEADSEDQAVLLSVVDINMEESDGCTVDSVRIYDGNDTSSPLIRTWCGQSRRMLAQSSGTNMTIVYTVDDSDNGKGIFLTFSQTSEAPPNTEIFPAEITYSFLTSPGYPNNYQPNTEWNFIIRVEGTDDESTIKVEVLTTDLPPRVNGECTNGRVVAYEGADALGIPLRFINTKRSDFCGKELPTLVSKSQSVFLKFNTGTSTTNAGFRLKYSKGNFQDEYISPCDEEFVAKDSPQDFTSPNYPSNYFNDLHCLYTIRTSDPNKNVRIVGTNLQIYTNHSHADCTTGDVLRVYEGEVTANPNQRYKSLCGIISEVAYQTLGNIVTLAFITDGSGVLKGFNIQYVQKSDTLPCDFVIKLKEGESDFTTLESPGYPNGYVGYRACSWQIQKASSDTRSLQVDVKETDITESPGCGSEYIRVFDGSSASSPIIGILCGSKAETFLASGDGMFIKFVSGPATSQHRGFRLTYSLSAFRQACPNEKIAVFAREKILQSPNYPLMYPRKMNCTWTLTSFNANDIVIIEVILSDMEHSKNCEEDRVEIYDGLNIDESKLLGSFCGKQTPAYRSSGQHVLVVLIANDNGVTGSGYQIKYYYKTKPGRQLNVASIAGGVIGGTAIFALMGLAVFCCLAKKDPPEKEFTGTFYLSNM